MCSCSFDKILLSYQCKALTNICILLFPAGLFGSMSVSLTFLGTTKDWNNVNQWITEMPNPKCCISDKHCRRTDKPPIRPCWIHSETKWNMYNSVPNKQFIQTMPKPSVNMRNYQLTLWWRWNMHIIKTKTQRHKIFPNFSWPTWFFNIFPDFSRFSLTFTKNGHFSRFCGNLVSSKKFSRYSIF